MNVLSMIITKVLLLKVHHCIIKGLLRFFHMLKQAVLMMRKTMMMRRRRRRIFFQLDYKLGSPGRRNFSLGNAFIKLSCKQVRREGVLD